MVTRKNLLAVLMAVVCMPAMHAMDPNANPQPAPAPAPAPAPNPAPAAEGIPSKAARYVSMPVDFIMDQVWDILHRDGYCKDRMVAKYGRAGLKAFLMYYIATNSKTKQYVGQIITASKNLLGISTKKSACTKAWDKECAACPRECVA